MANRNMRVHLKPQLTTRSITKSTARVHALAVFLASFFFVLPGWATAIQEEETKRPPTRRPQAPKVIGMEVNIDIPLIEREPYDEFQLDEYNSKVIVRIKPLKKPPSDPIPSGGMLIFESAELSDDLLQVPFENIVYYKTYIKLLMEDAGRLMGQDEYGKAFRNLLYVYDNGGSQNPKIVQALQTCLFEDARKSYASGNFELSLSIFEDLYREDPGFQLDGVTERPIDLIMKSLNENINQQFEQGKYESVAKALIKVKSEYEKDADPLIRRWNAKLVEQSDSLIQQARQHASSGNGRKAHLTARKANDVLPNRPEALALFAEIVNQYPLVFVGVSSRGAGANPLSIDDWGARRVGRLTMRSVVEFNGFGDEGGKYEFLNGEISQVDEAGFTYRLTLKPQTKFGIPKLTALELADRLLARGDAESDQYFVPFAKIVKHVAIEDENNILLTMRRQFVRPEALLQFLYQPNDGSTEAVQNGIYQLKETNDSVAVFGINKDYELSDDLQHPEIIEWKFPTSSDAVDALISGTIDAIDRVPLADINRLKSSAGIEVRPYAVPTVHMLVPNLRNDFTKNIQYRTGLKRGLDRDLILREMLSGGREIGGCEVVSGPFPIGTEENDQVSYAYNMRLTPQMANEKLGMVLTEIVFRTKVDQLREDGVPDPEKQVEKPKLVLAHSDDEVAIIASRAIQTLWQQLGLSVSLRQLEPGKVVPDDEEWDFLYYQIAMQEPLTDSERLFGAQGVVPELSAPVQQNMRKLGYADSWQSAGTTMRRLHRQIYNDVTVIPLFQLQEFYAYRDNVKNVGRSVVNFYENVFDWRIDPLEQAK